MSMFSAVTCCEEAGSAREDYNDITGVMSASVTLRCAWVDRHALAQDVIANRRTWPKGGFVLPTAHSASIVPVITPGAVPADGQEVIYGQALVTVNYSSIIADLKVHSLEPTVRSIKLNYWLFRWGAADGLPLVEEEAPGLLLRGLNLVITEMQVIPPLSPAILTSVGCVNDAPVTSAQLGLTFDTETLLYQAPSVTTTNNTLGQTQCQLVKKFTYQPLGWNKYPRALTNSWESIYIAGGDEYKVYPAVSFAGLL